jgi:hypothetical protein
MAGREAERLARTRRQDLVGAQEVRTEATRRSRYGSGIAIDLDRGDVVADLVFHFEHARSGSYRASKKNREDDDHAGCGSKHDVILFHG